jgi:hypothetical protein
LAGGSTGAILYQSIVSGTTFLPIGAQNTVLVSDGTKPTWSSVTPANATSVQIDGTTTSTPLTWYPTFVGGTGNNTNPRTPNISQNGLQFIPSTGNLSAISYTNISDRSFKRGIYDLNDVSSIIHTNEPTASDLVYDVNGNFTIVDDGGETFDDGPDIHNFPINGSENYAKVQYRVDDLFPKIYEIKCPDGTYKTQIGFVADDFVGTDLDFLVGTATIDDTEVKTLNYIGLIGLLTQEIKDLKTTMQLLLQSITPDPITGAIPNVNVTGIMSYTGPSV